MGKGMTRRKVKRTEQRQGYGKKTLGCVGSELLQDSSNRYSELVTIWCAKDCYVLSVLRDVQVELRERPT